MSAVTNCLPLFEGSLDDILFPSGSDFQLSPINPLTSFQYFDQDWLGDKSNNIQNAEIANANSDKSLWSKEMISSISELFSLEFVDGFVDGFEDEHTPACLKRKNGADEVDDEGLKASKRQRIVNDSSTQLMPNCAQSITSLPAPINDDTCDRELYGIDPDFFFKEGTELLPSSSEEAHLILNNLFGENPNLPDVDALANITPIAESHPPESDDSFYKYPEKYLKCRATDLPIFWFTNHLENFVIDKICKLGSWVPVVRCVYSGLRESQFPPNFTDYVASSAGLTTSTNVFRAQTHGLFLDMGDCDLLVGLIFFEIYDCEQSLAGNKGRIFLQCNNDMLPSDLQTDLAAFAGSFMKAAVIGCFDIMGKRGYRTTHFRAEDKDSQKWCMALLDNAKAEGIIMSQSISHFSEWLKSISSRRILNKIPFFNGDKLLQVIQEKISKQLQKSGFNSEKMWLSVHHYLKKYDEESFVAIMSHNTQFSKRCDCCPNLAACPDDLLFTHYSIFANPSTFNDTCQTYFMKFDSQSQAEASTRECILAAMCPSS